MAQLQEFIEREGEPNLCECQRHYVGTKCAYSEEERTAMAQLRILLPPGTMVYTILRHVSKSGMVRDISTLIAAPLGQPGVMDITYIVARALKLKRMDNGGVRVSGVGMDMGFNLVYTLSALLYPHGFTLAPGQHGRNGDTSGFDSDGGYALKQQWL